MSTNSVAARDANRTGATSRAAEIPVPAVSTENTLETATNPVTVAGTTTSDWAILYTVPQQVRGVKAKLNWDQFLVT